MYPDRVTLQRRQAWRPREDRHVQMGGRFWVCLTIGASTTAALIERSIINCPT
jgi:hypothetical protein